MAYLKNKHDKADRTVVDSAADIGLSNVANESRGTILDDAALTGYATVDKLTFALNSSAPTATEGRMYYNTTTKNLSVADGSSFINLKNTTDIGGMMTQYQNVGDSAKYQVHTFLSSGVLTLSAARTVDILLVGGGGASGVTGPGGGGGGVWYKTGHSLAAGSHTVTVGGGGNGGGAGGSSYLGPLQGMGGGGGGGSGGSSGGAGHQNPGVPIGPPATQTSHNSGTGYGYQGGGMTYSNPYPAGGGGGAGGNGSLYSAGPGRAFSIRDGTSVSYAGGGGSGTWGGGNYSGGGSGGGGPTMTNATRHTGGGAGGSSPHSNPHHGGSGIVIIRYTV